MSQRPFHIKPLTWQGKAGNKPARILSDLLINEDRRRRIYKHREEVTPDDSKAEVFSILYLLLGIEPFFIVHERFGLQSVIQKVAHLSSVEETLIRLKERLLVLHKPSPFPSLPLSTPAAAVTSDLFDLAKGESTSAWETWYLMVPKFWLTSPSQTWDQARYDEVPRLLVVECQALDCLCGLA